MTSSMTLHFLFYLGIIIPAIITLVLFVIFLFFLRKNRIRKEIMTKKHDPHRKFAKKREKDDSKSAKLIESEKYWNSTQSCHSGDYAEHNEAFDASPDLPGNDNKQMYNTFHDSGMSDLSETQYKFECDRPISQASTDSEDSGFRSSRSGQYIHSAQNSTGNDKDTPVFKPICSERERANASHNDCEQIKRIQSSRHSYPIQKKKSSHTRHHGNSRHNQRDIDLNEIETDLKLVPISTITQNSYHMPMHHLPPPPMHHSSDTTVPVSFSSQHQYGPVQMTPLLTSISKCSYMSTTPTHGLQSPPNPHKQTVTTAMVHNRPNIDIRHNAMSFSVV
ncbi:Hypothetical predicted protein [Mytilus galloprovincialis]|uniref:Uncharacterized protein n=1 Tax=Mytilus galloprovincialis TaxID=29158 RepID=A0A8B6C6U8_MYTGA|nr:Hypothetical predicted protein [Mytilus galloprovincialis]